MYYIDDKDAVATRPAPAPLQTPGWFWSGDIYNSKPPTLITADWLNTIQGEIANVIVSAGIALDKANSAQLLAALQTMFAGAGGAVAWATITGKPNTLAGYGITDGQIKLGFTPVQQGTGIGQSSNTVKIGWAAGRGVLVTVDSTDFGPMVFQNDLQPLRDMDAQLVNNAVLANEYADGINEKADAAIANANTRAPIRNPNNAGFGYVVSDGNHKITIDWDSNSSFCNLYVDTSFQGGVIHTNNIQAEMNNRIGAASAAGIAANGLGSYAISNKAGVVFGNLYSGADLSLAAGTWRCMNSTQTQGGFWVGLFHRIA
ncbi:hypothetical protein B0G84_4379 [Paraburkholderia sp. BL8N3]|jgi:hypothetical protein|nr:hypothetical protein [Paraburkholderia sp. BL8N3]TCK39051.1 hypothetical protein B0G84_4379 [Paraburkholderia sp. BL8N3]